MALFPFSFMQSQSPYDPDAAAFFARVAAAGGTLSNTEKTATNQLVLDMKSYGVWTSMKAVYPMVGASAAACAQNLVSSSFTGSFSSGWTFASTGVTPNGVSTYMNTGFNPSSNGSLNNGHFSVYLRTNIAQASADFGAYEGTSGREWVLYPRYTGDLLYAELNGAATGAVTSNSNSAAFFQVIRNTSATTNVFINATKYTRSYPTTLATNANLYLACELINGTPQVFSTRENAFASIGDGLTDTQASNFYTAVQTFNTTLNRSVGTPIVSDADAQAYINRVYTAGGTLTNTEANAVNQLVIDMKAAGIWTAMKAVYPMVGASAAACAQNLKSSSFTGTFSSGWTFASTGVTGNGTSTYMDSGLLPSTQLSLNSGHLSYYSRTNNSFDAAEIGSAQGGSQQTQIIINFSGVSYDSVNNSPAGTARTWNTDGCFIVSRTASNLYKSYRNSTTIATYSTASGTLPNQNIYVGGRNGGSLIPTNRECAFASIGDGLTDTQATALYNAVQTMNTTLSRQV